MFTPAPLDSFTPGTLSIPIFGNDSNRRGSDVFSWELDVPTLKPTQVKSPRERGLSMATTHAQSKRHTRFGKLDDTPVDRSINLSPVNTMGADREIEAMVTRNIVSRDFYRSNHTLVTYGKKLIAFGGKDEASNFRNTVGVYSVGRKAEWRQSDPKGKLTIDPRANHTAIVFKNKMYVYGGHNDMTFLDQFLVCDLDTMVWDDIPVEGGLNTHSPKSRFGHAACVCAVTDKMFLGGGMHLEEVSATIFEYSFVRAAWTKIWGPPNTFLNQIAKINMVCNHGMLYVIGMMGPACTPLTVHMMSTEDRSWSVVTTSGISPNALRISGSALTTPILLPGRNQWIFYVSADNENPDDSNPSIQFPPIGEKVEVSRKVAKRRSTLKGDKKVTSIMATSSGQNTDVALYGLSLTNMLWRAMPLTGVRVPSISTKHVMDFHTKYATVLYQDYILVHGGVIPYDHFFSVLSHSMQGEPPFKTESMSLSSKKAADRRLVGPPTAPPPKKRFMVPYSNNYALSEKTHVARQCPVAYINHDDEEKWESALYKLQREWLMAKNDEIKEVKPVDFSLSVLFPDKINPLDYLELKIPLEDRFPPTLVPGNESVQPLLAGMFTQEEELALKSPPEKDTLAQSGQSSFPATSRIGKINKKSSMSSALFELQLEARLREKLSATNSSLSDTLS